jgi:hypothetical protein
LGRRIGFRWRWLGDRELGEDEGEAAAATGLRGAEVVLERLIFFLLPNAVLRLEKHKHQHKLWHKLKI